MLYQKYHLIFAVIIVVLLAIPVKVLAWEGGSTGWCTDANGNNFRCSDGPPGGAGSGGGGGGGGGANLAPLQGAIQGAVNSMVNAWVIEQQRRANEAFNTNEAGNKYYADGDFVTAMQYYERAVSLNPNDAVIRNNLRNARSARARQLYELAYLKEDDPQIQLQYYEEAIRLDPLPEYVQSLKVLQESLERQRNYQKQKDEFASARTNAGNILDNIASKLGEQAKPVYTPGSTSELEFITDKEPVVSKGSKTSAPVELSEKAVPQDLKAGQPEKGLAMKDVPLPEVVPEWDPLSAKSPGEIVLKALEKGKIEGKMGPSNLDVSINYLENYLKTENPHNIKVKQAVSYLEGMRERAKLDAPDKKPNPFDPSPEDSQYLLEAIAGKKIPQWSGEKNPQPKPFGRHPLDWRKQRNQALLGALKENQGDWDKTAVYLEKKIAADTIGTDDASRNALQYLQAYSSYEEFSLKQSKPQPVKK